MAYNGTNDCSNDFLGCLQGKEFEDATCLTFSQFVSKYNADVTQLYQILCCMSDLPDLFDAQSLEGTDDAFSIPGDNTITQLFDGGAAPPNNEKKELTVNKDGNYSVSVKGRVSSATDDIEDALIRIGINGDDVGSIPLVGWQDYALRPLEGRTTISGFRVFKNLSAGDTINMFGNAKTTSAGAVDFSLLTLSAQLSLIS